MKKNRYVIPRARSIFPISLDSAAGMPDKPVARIPWMHGRRSEPPCTVAEKFSHFSVKLDTRDQDRYAKSFLKKRILQVWRKKRLWVLAASKFPPLMENAVKEAVWNEIKPLILPAFREDFNLPLMPFTLFGWLQYLKLLSQITGRSQDARFWDELTRFARICSERGLLDVSDDS
ncbi:hypothetical protein [Staphylospora marina]|uniref:hypothetical protein n=1 Tax=Staphylospora marina TaxID=2490858 RepID=UPI000F5BA4CD|nr:hypothetical protein [Staphylospora marina]